MLTAEDRARERRKIMDGAWPHFPVLPVVNREDRDPTGFPPCGLIFWRMGIENGPIKIYEVNLFSLPDLAIVAKKKLGKDSVTWAEVFEAGDVNVTEYADLDSFFDDGWMAD
jgi:hypothetical protein